MVGRSGVLLLPLRPVIAVAALLTLDVFELLHCVVLDLACPRNVGLLLVSFDGGVDHTAD